MSAVTPAVSLKPSGGLRRRLIVSRLMEILGSNSTLVRRGGNWATNRWFRWKPD